MKTATKRKVKVYGNFLGKENYIKAFERIDSNKLLLLDHIDEKYDNKSIITEINSENYVISPIKLDLNPFIKIEIPKTNEIITPDLSVAYGQNIKNQDQNFIKLQESKKEIELFSHSWIDKSTKVHQDKLANSFMTEYRFVLKTRDKKDAKKSVQSGLDKLTILQKDILPAIRIERKNKKGEFFLFVDIINKRLAFNNIVSLKQVFEEKEEVLSKHVEIVKSEISRQLIIASKYMPVLIKILDTEGSYTPAISIENMVEILTNTVNIFKILNIDIIIPKELKKLVTPKVNLKATVKDNSGDKGFLDLHSLLEFSYEIAIGDKKISPQEFKKLVKSSHGLIKYKEQYLLLKPQEVKSILNKLKSPLPSFKSPLEALRSAITCTVDGVWFNPDEALKKVLNDLSRVEHVYTPKSLNATLRPYQERGFQWLYTNYSKGFGSCIADDMGLGKTIQVISLILKLKEEKKLKKPVLIICPTTLVGNWKKEFEKFAPQLNIGIHYGAERSIYVKGIDALITTYGVLRRDIKKFANKRWNIVVIDEAQNIKNSGTDQTRAAKALKADGYIAMTGTPVENKLTELWNIFDFTNRGYLDSINNFKQKFARPIERHKDTEKIKQLRLAVSPFMIRRLKTDKSIIADLPDKLISDEYCNLTKEQAAIYENIVKSVMTGIEKLKEIEGIERDGLIFKLITGLKQVCNHPSHYAKTGNINSQLSGKAQKTIFLLQNALENQEKTLIFTQYKEMGDILVDMILDELDQEALFFHGGLARKRRDEIVEEFQNTKNQQIMILSLKAGGTGLNLTAASNIIHYDLWWNPAVENQATDRAYRIGQDKNVLVHRLITLGTFEEKIDEMIKVKKELADLTVSTGEQWITKMSNDDLRNIFTLYKE